jgi:hypothetical protein
MTPVKIGMVAAKGGDLVCTAIQNNLDDAELGAYGLGMGEKPKNFFGASAGGDVNILRLAMQEIIPNPSSRKKRFMTI